MKKYLKIFGNVVLYLGIMISMNYAVAIFVNYLIYSKIIAGDAYKWLYQNQGVLTIATVLLSMGLYLLIFKLKKKSFVDFCELKPIDSKPVAKILVIALAMGIFTTAFTSISFILERFPEVDLTINFFMGSGSIIIAILSSVLLMPALEEIIFRGLIFSELKSNMALPIVFLISNSLYTILQPNLLTMIFGFVGGILFTLAYLWTKSLWGAIILQTSSCFFMLIFRRLGVHMVFRSFGDIVLAILVLVTAIVIAYVMFSIGKDSKKLSQASNNLSI